MQVKYFDNHVVLRAASAPSVILLFAAILLRTTIFIKDISDMLAGAYTFLSDNFLIGFDALTGLLTEGGLSEDVAGIILGVAFPIIIFLISACSSNARYIVSTASFFAVSFLLEREAAALDPSLGIADVFASEALPLIAMLAALAFGGIGGAIMTIGERGGAALLVSVTVSAAVSCLVAVAVCVATPYFGFGAVSMLVMLLFSVAAAILDFVGLFVRRD